ncbi:MAG: DoxX family protein [Acidimicrobiales bacterium]
MLARRVARPLLAATFVSSGIQTLRNPGPRVEKAEAVAPKIAENLPPLPKDTDTLVKINAAAQIVAGLFLAIGRLPRLAALVLAGSLVPTTAAGHRFWEVEDGAQRAQQQIHFLKNAGLLGGLILAALDTEGAPSLGWRARRAAERVREKVT